MLYMQLNSHGGTALKSAKVHIAAFLWFAGNKTVLRVVALLFNTSVSTMFSIINRITKFLLNLGPQIIFFPESDHDKEAISNKFFQISGFPNVLGCIDGTYIHLKTPAHKVKSTYVNRHDVTALTLQGICDSERKFLDVFTGVSGKIHDARVYEMSFIKNKINNLEEKHHILGDAAYPISPNLLTPYRNYGQLNPVNQEFNKRFSQTRVKIENAFGLLKVRFRQLMELDFRKVEKASEFIIACCILHNLCIEHEDFLEDVMEDHVERDYNPPVYERETDY
ncbi:putative nuclease HARBI1 [Anoplophora glabripennis]|uniref:putative nuclease HARBI1 n=1 Tax=Anoplophora glabripennis TaxID=217634 RepID=UPI0008749B3C|nr:putative nuclease HARBI1 [Anoplophora glabripennis]